MQQLITAIQQTLATDQASLDHSLNYFVHTADTNYPWLVAALAHLISDNVDLPAVYRQQAALQLKNIVKHHTKSWLRLQPDLATTVMQGLLDALCSERSASGLGGGALTQCLHAVAELELPRKGWPSLLPRLLEVALPSDRKDIGNNHDMGRLRAIEAIGYICETVGPEHVEYYINDILTGIVAGVESGVRQSWVHLICASLTALSNALEFASSNIARQSERNYIMQVICESTQNSQIEVVVASLQCLSRTICLYYPLMEDYLTPAIWPISIHAIASQSETVALQGLEVCCSICDAELALVTEDAVEEEEAGQGTGWIHPVLTQLVPALLQGSSTSPLHPTLSDYTPNLL